MTTKYLTTEELEVSRELLDIEHGHHTPKAPPAARRPSPTFLPSHQRSKGRPAMADRKDVRPNR